jgi:hypothetical protein
MKSLLIILVCFFGLSQTMAADVVCSCKAPEKCSDIQINFVAANPGVYLTIQYAYGEKNLEGFANVTRDSKENRVIYKLENFILLEQDDKYTLPGKLATCN